MTALADILKERIMEGGPMPFPAFMAAALYTPGLGYYASPGPRTGRGGDFYTSVSVGPVFGEIMAEEFCAAWQEMGKPHPFAIVEAGANDAAFARDVLSWARRQRPDFFSSINYQLDEPLENLQALQRKQLEDFSGHFTHDSVSRNPAGCYFANELLDALPCRRVRFTGGRWKELYVTIDGTGGFGWMEREVEDSALKRRLLWLGEDFPEGYTTEVAPAVASHLRIAADRLERGYLFFVDYGFPAADYYHPSRMTGTLRGYRQHKVQENVFEAIGETDLTVHVDFSYAATAAAAAGCEVLGFVDQGRYLTAAASGRLREMERSGRVVDGAWRRQFQTLIHPAHLGSKFHSLVLGKNVQNVPALPGLQFAGAQAVEQLLEERFHPDSSGRA